METVIVRYGELSLKGKNRSLFEKRMRRNIRSALGPETIVERNRLRIFVRFEDEPSRKRGIAQLAEVFGVSSVSPVQLLRPDISEMELAVKALAQRIDGSHFRKPAFRVSVQRLEKLFPLSSVELERRLGSVVTQSVGWPVNLHAPEIDIQLEILKSEGEEGAALFVERIPGPGGLPVGVEGKVLCIWGLPQSSAERDALGAWFCLRRGCRIIIAMADSAASSHDARIEDARAEELAWLARYAPGPGLRTIPLTDVAEIPALLEQTDAKAVVLSAPLSDYPSWRRDIALFDPLCGMSEEDIRTMTRKLKAGASN